MKNSLAERLITIAAILFAGAALVYWTYPMLTEIALIPTSPAESPALSSEVSFGNGPGFLNLSDEKNDQFLTMVVTHWRIYFNRTAMIAPEEPWHSEAIQLAGYIQIDNWYFFQVRGSPTWQHEDADLVTFAYQYCERCTDNTWKLVSVWSARLNRHFTVVYDPETGTGTVLDTDGTTVVFETRIAKGE